MSELHDRAGAGGDSTIGKHGAGSLTTGRRSERNTKRNLDGWGLDEVNGMKNENPNYNHKFGHPLPERVAILRALQLGDLLCVVPALRALRVALPSAQITLVGLPWARDFVDRFNQYLDDFIELPGFPGLPERPAQVHRLPQFLSEVQWLDFDLAIQMQGSGIITNSLICLFGARRCAGYFLPGRFCPDEKLFMPYPVQESEIKIHLSLMERLGFPSQGEHLEFPLYPEDWEEFRDLAYRYNLEPGGYVCIHPGARAQARRWPAGYFATVADGLAARGLQVVLTGSSEEAQLTAAVAAQTKAPAIDLAGRTGLGSLAAMLSKARLLVCNDTGASHIAAALSVPSVVLFTGSDPKRWAPLNEKLHRAVAWTSAGAPEIVLDEAEELFQEERAYAA